MLLGALAGVVPVCSEPVRDASSTRGPRHRDTVVALTVSDLRARYGQGILRRAKWLLDPFFATGIYLLLVVLVLDRPGDDPGLSIACATVPFQLVIAAVVAGLTVVQSRASIVLNMRFPRGLIPLASTITEAIAFSSALGLIALMMVVYRVPPTLAILWAPVVIAVTFTLALAAAYPATLIGLWAPNARPLVVNLVRTLFFIAPGLVALADVPESVRPWLALNPVTGLFESYRSIFLYGHRPAAWEVLVPLAWAAGLLVVCGPVYRREQRQFAKVVEG